MLIAHESHYNCTAPYFQETIFGGIYRPGVKIEAIFISILDALLDVANPLEICGDKEF